MMSQEKLLWVETTQLLQHSNFEFGSHWSFNFRNDPRRLLFVLSRYKFAAKMTCRYAQSILELGCSEGIGASILTEQAKSYLGIDLDESALITAQKNLKKPKFSFQLDDFLGKTYGVFDAVISLDVIEHIVKPFEREYLQTIHQNLEEKGSCIIGTPNITSEPYASEASQKGHVNLFSQQRLVQLMRDYFHIVLPFGMNDEVVHTGFSKMTHYLFVIGCYKK